MRVARYHGREDVPTDDVSPPGCGMGELRIDVEWAGICGTDLHEYTAGPIGIPTENPHPLTGETVPVPMGDECLGTVTEAGNGTSTAAGMPVAVNPILWCGDCPYCDTGQYRLCERGGAVGRSGGSGGFAESMVVDERQAVPIRG
jgi:(R,R)-butanediol dehydrogenase/meso-butanediol dehydrogenase/diacetyl reductase